MKTIIASIQNRNLIRMVLCTCFLWLASAVTVRSQTGPASSADAPERKAKAEESFKIRVSVDEVRIDAVILDWRGRQITDLTADDFEIYQDEKRQEIISAVYVSDQTSQPDSQAPVISADAPSRDTIRRTLLFLVDDLSMGFVDHNHTRMGLNNFVEKQMQPGDLVGILCTSTGSGPLFSSDKRQLLAAIENIQWETSQAIAGCGPGG